MRISVFIFLLIVSVGVGVSQENEYQGEFFSSKSGVLVEPRECFFEIDSIVSILPRHANYIKGWHLESNSFVPFSSMVADSSSSERILKVKVKINNPASYRIWVLARKKLYFSQQGEYIPEKQILNYSIYREENQSDKKVGKLSLQDFPDYVWSGCEGISALPVDAPGEYILELGAWGENWGMAVDKIVLSAKRSFTPFGKGPEETDNLSAIPDKRGFDADIILPPHWAFGVLYGGYTDQEGSLNRVRDIISHDYPIDAYWIDSWFWNFNRGKGPDGFLNFTGDVKAYPDLESMWKTMDSLTIRSGVWVWNAILKNGNEQWFEDYNKRGYFDTIYHNTYTWHNAGGNSLIGVIDLEREEVSSYFQYCLKPLFDKGLDFFKLDRNDEVPFAKSTFEATQKYGKHTRGRGFILQHIGALSSPEFKKYPTKWSGDSKTCWSEVGCPDYSRYTRGGLQQNVEMVADPARYMYDVPFLTNDAGGFTADNVSDEELYIRWIQFAVFNPVMEIFSSGNKSTLNLAWNVSERADSVFRKYTHLRMQLFPYIYSYAMKTRLEGAKMIQGDGKHRHQYLFGKEILVAPVVEKGQQSKTVFLPEGEWINFFTGERYLGGQKVDMPLVIEDIPVFVKSGAIIPRRAYARAIELGSNEHIYLDIYTPGSSSFDLIEDDGISNAYLDGGFSTTTISQVSDKEKISVRISPIVGPYVPDFDRRTWTITVKNVDSVKDIMVNGHKFHEYVYDSRDHKITLDIVRPLNEVTEIDISK